MTIRTSLRRSLTAAVAAGALTAGALATVAPATAAEPITTTSASLVWGYSGYAHQGAFGVPWAFKSPVGNVNILKAGVQDEYTVAHQPVTSLPSTASTNPNAAKFVSGTGTVDPDTGASTLAWTGSFTINAYPSLPAGAAAPDETYADPELSVAADGSGSLTFDVTIGAGFDMDGNPTPAQNLGDLTVAQFAAGTLTGNATDGYRLTPKYQGVTRTAATGDAPQDTTCTGANTWGSWPTAFVGTMPSSIRAHYYSTGCGGLNNAKPALPLDLQVEDTDVAEAASSIALTSSTLTYGKGGTLGVTVSSTAGTPAGDVTLKGIGADKTATLSGGKASFALPKTLSVGSRTATVSYAGGAGFSSSQQTRTITVKKASAARPTVSVSKKPTSKKTGKATVTVKSTVSGQTPTGKVKVTLTKGSSKKSVSKSLSKGKASITLPKLKKGTWKLKVTYYGSSTHSTSTSKTYTVKSSK